jgi:hypothetical protein
MGISVGSELETLGIGASITAELGTRPETVDRGAALARLTVARSTVMELHAELEAVFEFQRWDCCLHQLTQDVGRVRSFKMSY